MCRCVFIIMSSSCRNGQTGVILCYSKRYQGLYSSPLSKVIIIWGNLITMMVVLHAQGNGQSRHCECSCINRLNKLVIHTPTAACGCQKEEKKSVIMER